MLDHLSNGRLELGLAVASPMELSYFGVDAAQTRAIFDETMAILVAGMTNERLTFEGRHYQYRDVPMEIHPCSSHTPLWYPTNNPDSVDYVARHGYNFADIGPASARAPACGQVSVNVGSASS
jgi:alkanesulfonate monooxygenase SsuD/methylene tetrahydromethanopterin reductase-like flavin-dependent oxidoreductase (luciferase family)